MRKAAWLILSYLACAAIGLRGATVATPPTAAGKNAAAGAAVSAPQDRDLSDMPLWAYGETTLPQPGDTAKPQAGPAPAFDPDADHDAQLVPQHAEGSTRAYSRFELTDWQNPADWFPDEHAPMPDVVAHGPARLGAMKRACAFCHRTTGGGRPDNAQLARLPVAYFLRQLDDFRSGRRKSSDPRKPNIPTMAALAAAVSAEEARAAAEYYAAQSGGPALRVIETDRAPPVRLRGHNFVAASDTRSEPLTGRIVEVPENPGQSEELDNPHFGFVAYVPKGSIARGRELVTTGTTQGARAGAPVVTLACITCHGADLRGSDQVPPLAGRSPSYLVRQLYDFRSGARNGNVAPLMKPVAARLTVAQMIDIAAYLAAQPR